MTLAAEFPTLEGFDPFSQDFLGNPGPWIKRAQAEAPVFYYPPLKMWVVTRYDDICKAARDWKTFSSRALSVVPQPEHLMDRLPPNWGEGHFITIDPPEHTLSRGAVTSLFLPEELKKREGAIRAIATELIDGFIAKGTCDFMHEFGYPLSLKVVIGLLNVPPERYADYRQWTEDYFLVFSPKTDAPKQMPEQERLERWSRLADAQDFFKELVDQRRACPVGDIINQMIDARGKDGNPIPEHRLIRHITELVAAGNDTTANLMAQMLMYLDSNPSQFAEVRENHDLIPNVVEETLRLRGTSPGLFRITTRDVEIGGATIPANEVVWLLFIGGGLDESKFVDSERFDIHRANSGDHLAFGHGRHTCLGNPLARLEARIAFEELLRRIPDIRVTPGQTLAYQPNMTVLTLDSLKAEWKVP